MFTGLVQAVGRVARVEPNEFGVRLSIDGGGWSYRPAAGDSVSVSGCCLTHAPGGEEAAGLLVFDVIRQTLERTTLGGLREGGRVNLESCLTPSTPIGGHFVLGHVDGVAEVEDVYAGTDQHRVTIRTDERLIRWIVPTGSVAVDGVSLTVAEVEAGARRFTVALIPTTLRLTTLGERRVGDRVNIEGDVLVKSVVNYLEQVAPTGSAGLR